MYIVSVIDEVTVLRSMTSNNINANMTGGQDQSCAVIRPRARISNHNADMDKPNLRTEKLETFLACLTLRRHY